jgi:hypothetical protein
MGAVTRFPITLVAEATDGAGYSGLCCLLHSFYGRRKNVTRGQK